MDVKDRKNWIWLIGLVILIALASLMAYLVRSDFGNVEVKFVEVTAPDGHLVTGRLYRPKEATQANPMPAVIAAHGGNNDKDTQAPVAIELARRGFVVLAVDMDGHGDNSIAFDPGVMFTGQSVLGVDAAFDYMAALPFVDSTKIGLTGHSLGGMMSVGTALLRPEHAAVVPQDACTGVRDISVLNNYMCVYAIWESDPALGRNDEFFYTPAFYQDIYGFSEPIEPNYRYGNFEDGSAFEIALNKTTHPGMPPSHQMVTAVVDWMRQALKGGTIDSNWIPSMQHTYVWYDVFMGVALVAALGSVIPLANILLAVPFFAVVAQPMAKRYIAKPGDWRKMALVNALIAGVTYPFFTQTGWFGNIGNSFQAAFPFLNMLHPNGLYVWMIGNAIIFAVMFYFWYRKNSREANITMYDMGVSFDEEKTKFDWGILGKTFLLAVLLIVWLYILVAISQAVLGVEFRVEYPTLKTIPTAARFGQFFIYFLPVLIFMLLNNGIFLFGQARQPEYETEKKTQLIWWAKNLLASLSVLALLLALQNIPIMFFNANYGFDIIGLSALSTAMGGEAEWMMAIVLWFLIPLFTIFLYLLTWFFRKTGKIYLGSIFIAILITWQWVVGNNILS